VPAAIGITSRLRSRPEWPARRTAGRRPSPAGSWSFATAAFVWSPLRFTLISTRSSRMSPHAHPEPSPGSGCPGSGPAGWSIRQRARDGRARSSPAGQRTVPGGAMASTCSRTTRRAGRTDWGRSRGAVPGYAAQTCLRDRTEIAEDPGQLFPPARTDRPTLAGRFFGVPTSVASPGWSNCGSLSGRWRRRR